jgi:NAD(P)-dependent dehydrogenase (short-subunit alcohol dehydrogenase family)
MFRDGLFDGQVALVTGGGSGIGLATATEPHLAGRKRRICGRNAEKIAAARVTSGREAGIPTRASSVARATSETPRPSRGSSARSSIGSQDRRPRQQRGRAVPEHGRDHEP